MTDTIRVLIADDHAVVRHGLRLFLDVQPDVEVVGEAENGAAAVERAQELRPDVVVMDVVMPEVDGIKATEELRDRSPEVKVLALSTFSDDDHVLPTLAAGASGFLTKDTRPEEIAQAIRSVHRGDPVLCTEATRRVLRRVHGGEQGRPEGTVTVVFTDIENSTPLVERLGDERARELFLEHDRLVRQALERTGGVEVEREGDKFMLAFSSARRAVRCAIEIQRALERSGVPLRVRAGLNTGDVIAQERGYFGRAVFLASRVADAAGGGEILVSEVTRSLAADGDVEFRERGTHELKGLKGRHRLYEVIWSA
ncbi:MAG TPA: response regulator [Gaiellaceae bacterium]|nr:response regulator [Gaiellaceae bacterium]